MKLSPQILLAKMEEWGYRFTAHLPGRGMYLERPVFYGGGSVEDGRVYILPSAMPLPEVEMPKKAVFLSERGINITENILCGLAVSEDSLNAYELLNLSQRVFDFYDHWEEKLRNGLDEELSLQAILDESVEIFGNPVTVSTADFFLLASSGIMEEREELRELLDPNNLFEYCTAFKQDEEYNRAREYRHAFYYPEYITGYRNLCVNIFDHGVYAYRIAIPEVLDCFRPGMPELLEYMAGFVEKILSRRYVSENSDGNTLHSILENALTEGTVDTERLSQRLAAYGWGPEHSYVCLDFQTAMLDQQNLTVNFICRHIESLIPHACAFRYRDDIVVFVNLTRFGGTAEDVYRKIIIFLRDSYLKVGFSRPFSGFPELPYYYGQAKAALETGSRFHPYQWAHNFEDTALFYMLSHAQGDFPAKICCSEKIQKLQEYDREHQTEFYRTLKVYLDNEQNAVQSARELFIHRSTFLYRLERIREMTGMDLSNRDERLYYQMSFRMLELFYGDVKDK